MEPLIPAFLYILPMVINMAYAIQTHSKMFATFAFIPAVNVVTMFICIGEFFYNFFV